MDDGWWMDGWKDKWMVGGWMDNWKAMDVQEVDGLVGG